MGNQPTKLLSRDHITDTLAEALGAPLVVLTAPAGYGKTIVAQRLASSLNFPSFYLSVPQDSGSPRWLWDHFCSRLMRDAERKGRSLPLTTFLKSLNFPENRATLRAAIKQTRSAIAKERILLIIDDWQFADSPEFESFWEHLARAKIPGLTLLLLSRSQPGFAMNDLRIKKLTRVFGQDLLTFSEEETRAYFAENGISNAAMALRAWKTCEGWSAGLWLNLEACKRMGENEVPPDATSKSLLDSAVFQQCSLEEQNLLLQCSLLEFFTPAQAALTSGIQAAPRLLHSLREHNAFISYDPLTGHYRLHSLFRSFLAERLDETSTLDKAALYRRAGEGCLREGDLLWAAQFFHRAGRDEDLLRFLEIFTLPRSNLLLLYSPDKITRLILSIPWRLRAQRPLAYLAFIYFYLAECDPLAALPLLEEAEAHFEVDPDIPTLLKRRITGEAVLIRGVLAFNDFEVMGTVHMAAHELLRGRSAISSRHMIWNFACPHSAYLYLREAGSYAGMVEFINANLHYFHDLSDGCGLGAELLFQAERLLERGEFAEVESVLRAAVFQAESKEQLAVILSAAFCMARLYAATGRAHEAPDFLLELMPKVNELERVDLFTCLDLALGYLYACLGQTENIPTWLRRGDFSPPRFIPQTTGFMQAVHGKAALLAGDYLRLDAVSRALPGALGQYNNLFGHIHAKVQEALAAKKLYSGEKALAALDAALSLARPDGIMLSIAEYGTSVLPLLRALHKRNPQDEFTAALIRLAMHYPRTKPAPSASFGRPTPVARTKGLTRRECETLHLAAKGGTNVEIAAQMGISAETVKKLLSSAYLKLGAKNRIEAVRSFLDN